MVSYERPLVFYKFAAIICTMSLFCEICTVLDDAEVGYSTEKVLGSDVIFVGDVAVIPINIRAKSMEAAVSDARIHEAVVSQILEQKKVYPLTIAEDRWKSQREMMASRLLAHAGIFTQIYARNCEIRKTDRQTAADFLSKNHSYGDAKCRYRYGLYLKRHTGHNAGNTADGTSGTIAPGTLVAVATFSNARKWVKGDKIIRSYEWTRYASLPGVRLSGGMGRLLKAFIEDVKPDDIMTYADLEWSEGKVYEALGFILEGHKEPVSFIVDSSWKRIPIKNETHNPSSLPSSTSLRAKRGNLYFRNLGSNKYRLKLTDYQ